MSDYSHYSHVNPDYGASRETAMGVGRLREQNAEVIAHLDATVAHLEIIADQMRSTSEQNQRMLNLSRWTLIAALTTLVATVGVAVFA